MILKIIVFVINMVYGIPLWKKRYEFRSLVYKDKSWSINVKPYFVKETHALFSNKYFKGNKQLKIAHDFRWYLVGYVLLWLLFIVV